MYPHKGVGNRSFPMGVAVVLLAFLLSLQTLPMPTHAETVYEISPSNGSTTCGYLSGPGVDHVAWNSSNSTCTVFGNRVGTGIPGPMACIANSNFSGSCAGTAIDRLIVDQGVTILLKAQTDTFYGVTLLCVYSTLENQGTIEGGSICDYGTIINYGTIIIPVGSFFETLPENGFGILVNEKGGDLVNNYIFSNAGNVFNNGTIHNRGVFYGNDNRYKGTLTNDGSYIGSAPCTSFDGCMSQITTYSNVTSTGTTIRQFTGVSLYITGATSNQVVVISQNQTTAAPLGLGQFRASSAIFFDVLIIGISTGNARVCFTNSRVTPSMAGSMQYWNGTAWVLAGNQSLTSTTTTQPPTLNQTLTVVRVNNTLCGDVPVAALSGTPLGLGSPSATQESSSALSNVGGWLYVAIAFAITALAITTLAIARRKHHESQNHSAWEGRNEP